MNENQRLASTIEKVINSLVDLPDTLKKVLKGTDSIVKQMPPHCTHKDQWKASNTRRKSSTTGSNVGTLTRKLESKCKKSKACGI